MPFIAAIIPAFNEAPRIGRVLDVITQAEFFNRIVVVNDGSQDDTGYVVGPFIQGRNVELISHSRNLGKGAALQTGLKVVGDMDYVMFLDADLVGLTVRHLRDLIRPLIMDQGIGMTVGRFVEGRPSVDLQQKWFAILNGQRALAAWFVRNLPDLAWSRFGVEVLLSRYARDRGVPVDTPLLKGITHVPKEEKFGLIRGFRARLNMYKEVVAAYMRYPTMVNRSQLDEPLEYQGLPDSSPTSD